jgi:hypothetical protein
MNHVLLYRHLSPPAIGRKAAVTIDSVIVTEPMIPLLRHGGAAAGIA